MSSEVEELWAGLEELDATFQRQTEDAQADRDALRTVMQTLEGTKLDTIWPTLERTEQAAVADRVALRGLMEMVEDSMPIADAHELLEAQTTQFTREIEKLNRARQLDVARTESLEAEQSAAKVEREKLKESMLLQERLCGDWSAAQKTLQEEHAGLAKEVGEHKLAADVALAELASSQSREAEEIVSALGEVGRRQDEMSEQLVALALALREENLQQSTAQASAMSALVSDVATKMATLERISETQAGSISRAEEATSNAKRVSAEARGDTAAVRTQVDELASQVRGISSDLSSERRGVEDHLGMMRQSAETVRNDLAAAQSEMQAAAAESAARHVRVEKDIISAVAAIQEQTDRFGVTVSASQEAQSAANARVKLEGEALGARVDALHSDLAKMGAEVAEAGRKVTDSGRQLNLRASAMQEGYDDFAEKLQAHEAKVRKLLIEYTSLAATQDTKLDALHRDTTEVRREAGSAAAKLESAAQLQSQRADGVAEVARTVRAEFDRLVEKLREGEREHVRLAEQRLAEMRTSVDRSEEKRLENVRECEARCKGTELEVRSQRAAADRRLALVEREIAESANAVTDRAHQKIGESARTMEQQLTRLETRLMERISSGAVAGGGGGGVATPRMMEGMPPLTSLSPDAGLLPTPGSG